MAVFCRAPMISPEAWLLYQIFPKGPLWEQDGSFKALETPSEFKDPDIRSSVLYPLRVCGPPIKPLS
jgi:hypothetical protein